MKLDRPRPRSGTQTPPARSSSGRTPAAQTRPGAPAAPLPRSASVHTDGVDAPGRPRALPGLKPAGFQPLESLPAISAAPTPDGLPPPAEGVLQGWWSRVQDMMTGSTASREVNRARKAVADIGRLAPAMAALSDTELAAQTDKLKAELARATAPQREALERAEARLAGTEAEGIEPARLAAVDARRALARAQKKTLDKLLPEAFATARESARRATGMFPYDVQVMAGVLMHHGLVAEMYTGEGKTLAASLPAYLNALAGEGFHVVTVNDYLARRDAEEMGQIYARLGLSVGILQNDGKQLMLRPTPPGSAPEASRECTRREAYQADITYGTASEFAFDHLRDHQVRSPEQRVQRELWGVLLDEVDSLLLDEARTPHILAGPGPSPDAEKLGYWRDVVNTLDWKTDVEWSVEEGWVQLTESGYAAVEKLSGIGNLYEAEHADSLAMVHNALRARFLMREDEHYTILGGEIRTVGHGGHAMVGRRFTAGLHQALESKHDLEVRPENVTSASITMRDFLSEYAFRSGMTGTALSAKEVFRDVYHLDVARVPTRKPLIRVDHPDKVFATEAHKLEAFLDDLEKTHATGRPVLVGCEWTSTAEALGKAIQARGLPCEVLGAKSDAVEAEIIAGAGRLGSIVVATTRGGRGVDVKLGGDAKRLTAKQAAASGKSPDALRAEVAGQCAEERAQVLALGGLLVMGYEHLDSRRRDDQLRGRGARQGDPGASVFYASLEDPLFDGFEAVEKIRDGKSSYDASRARGLVEAALDRSENKVNDALIQSQPYDNIVDGHRRRFNALRDDLMALSDVRPFALGAIDQVVENVFQEFGAGTMTLDAAQAQRAYDALREFLPIPPGKPPPKWTSVPVAEVRQDVEKLVGTLLDKRDAAVGEEFARLLERDLLLKSLDEAWSGYLTSVQDLRTGIGYRAYAQKDPKLEFAFEAHHLFQGAMNLARTLFAGDMLKRIPKKIETPDHAPAPAPAPKD